ncbi:aminoacyl-tRNA hydrolase [Natronoflexus pectinivorans]|uniref:Peptidyl-tRNA hydrolase n=1 Tax=Natronoflexus pectinivorans TaxID=682526 RepID=A0A4R2GN78_9BACT|nr:aminoacyl-tRNA hydrolase [Natronoflexus pectinivorans]TCO10458.1 PTH1 family peptidyl-tRNA hydrolase [Natronoflexus pectinivorans]
MIKRLLINIFGKKTEKETTPSEMKYLIVGLGNIGSDYANTRHNIGFDILDALAHAENVSFDDKRYGMLTQFKHKGRIYILLKPSTYVNLSGRAVNYWMKKENIQPENLLVVVDDLALPFGKLRLKAKGSDAGHNGLRNIQDTFGHNQYARLRFGIGDNFRKGHQVDYVLGKWTPNEAAELPQFFDSAIEIIKSFGTLGITRTMNLYNKR